MIKILANIISGVFYPLFMPLYVYVMYSYLMFNEFIRGTSFFLSATFMVVVFSIIIPVIGFLVYFFIKQDFSDVFMKNQKNRPVPYLICLFSYLIMILVFNKHEYLYMYSYCLVGAFVALFFVFLINFSWKISIHTTALGAVFVLGIFYSICTSTNPYWFFVVILLISGLVGSSRIYLKSHSLSQVISGFCLGIFSGSVPLVLLFLSSLNFF